MSMFCDQCEQTLDCKACTSQIGVCGKNEDVHSLQEILLYGLKGMAAYKAHARRLGWVDAEVEAFIEEALFSTMTNVSFDLQANLDMVLRCGEMNLKVMEGLDAAHGRVLGTPSPTEVREGTLAGPGILITGHDMMDLVKLLQACEGTPVKVYTHGEMLPAHMYPNLRNHANLAGHYGDAWQKQKGEFAAFPGPIVVNTNCVVPPAEQYRNRIWTTNAVSVVGGKRINDCQYDQVVQQALSLPPCVDKLVKTSTVGFHHSVIGAQADALLEAVKSGKVRRVFVIGGCDGAESERSYFADYAKAVPQDCFILTLGCGKYRIRNHDYGTLLGLPRLMDMGQCNDAYGAIRVAAALAEKAGCGVNDLPLTLCLSWFEQKAVAVLLSLLHLGVKGIRIGPRPPAFISPNVFRILQDTFDLDVIGKDAAADVATAMTA
ncbi:MAG TPA: hydroxylamine reductase [Rhodoferax sp.]